MPKIIQKYEECIGCGSCVAICPDVWEMDSDGKVKPIGGKKTEDGNYELEISEVGCNNEAVEICPVDIIRIE